MAGNEVKKVGRTDLRGLSELCQGVWCMWKNIRGFSGREGEADLDLDLERYSRANAEEGPQGRKKNKRPTKSF